MLVPIPYVHLTMGIAVAVLAVPLILRRVPKNPLYGIRTCKAFASDENWYALNERGGWLFLAFGVFLAAFGWVTRMAAPPPSGAWAPVYMIVPLLGLVPVAAELRRFGRRLSD